MWSYAARSAPETPISTRSLAANVVAATVKIARRPLSDDKDIAGRRTGSNGTTEGEFHL
jgi:hypothetical protein